MKLIKFNTEPLELTFELQHEEYTQNLTLTSLHQAWTAEINMDTTTDDDPNNAVKKLGEMLYRMSQAIMTADGEFGKIDLTNIDIKNS